MVLKVDATEEEGHDGAEAETDRLRAVEVLLERGLHHEAIDDSQDEGGDGEQGRKRRGVGDLSLSSDNCAAEGTAKAEDPGGSVNDEVHHRLGLRVDTLHP